MKLKLFGRKLFLRSKYLNAMEKLYFECFVKEILDVVRWQLIADRNERPNRVR